MTYTTITVSGIKISVFQRDFLIKSGFAMIGTTLSRSVKSSEIHIILGQLANKNIPFNLKTVSPTYTQGPCGGCKH